MRQFAEPDPIASEDAECAPAKPRMPFYLQIAIGLAAGTAVGTFLHPHWRPNLSLPLKATVVALDFLVDVVMRLLRAVASPLILLAVVKSISRAKANRQLAERLIFLLFLNASVAVGVALLIVNIVQPGRRAHLNGSAASPAISRPSQNPAGQLLSGVPSSVLSPFVENNAIGVIIVALAVGTAARYLSARHRAALSLGVDVALSIVTVLLHWILRLVPLAVACKITTVLTTNGIAPFKALLWFVATVVLALIVQSSYYLLRLRLCSPIRPLFMLRGTRDALLMAFSTASSVATMPLSFQCLTEHVGIPSETAALGVFVGGNFNHDGAAVYEAISALFVAQAIGFKLSIVHQALIVISSMLVSIGAAGVPEAGLVMISLVFGAVGLPIQYAAFLLPVDWFLDRCRTTVNVLGDLNISCMLQRRAMQSTIAQCSERVPFPESSNFQASASHP